MAYVETYPAVDRHEVLRWSFCAAAVFAAHALVLLALWARPDDQELDAGAPVVLIELSPISAAPPTPQRDLAPGLEQLQAEPQREEKTEEQRPETERMPNATPAPEPAVTLPAPEPPKQQQQAKQEPANAVPVPTAPPAAVAPAHRPASPSLGRVSRPSAAMVSWQRALMAQIERHKRYPPQAHGEQGIAKLAFRLDRNGRVVTSRIQQSSGSAALDDETLALIKRAQPFPPPPGDVGDEQLSFVVPIRYAVSGKR